MATRRKVKNVQQGFFDQNGFHPIRASRDYDSDRLFDSENEPRRAKKKKPAAKKKRKNPSQPASYIPSKWTTAKVKTNSKGQVQVMLPVKLRKK